MIAITLLLVGTLLVLHEFAVRRVKKEVEDLKLKIEQLEKRSNK